MLNLIKNEIQNNSIVEHLDLSNKEITKIDVNSLGLLSRLRDLKSINLEDNKL